MEFHWKNGCLPVEEYNELIRVINALGNIIYIPSLGGFSEDNKTFCAIDLISKPKEIKELAQIVKDFADSL